MKYPCGQQENNFKKCKIFGKTQGIIKWSLRVDIHQFIGIPIHPIE
jgi:hypothetical protein